MSVDHRSVVEAERVRQIYGVVTELTRQIKEMTDKLQLVAATATASTSVLYLLACYQELIVLVDDLAKIMAKDQNVQHTQIRQQTGR